MIDKFRFWDGEKMFYFTFADIWGGGIYIDSKEPYRADLTHRLIKKMLFTGLKDKNGKEIFEGDIIKIPGAKQGLDVYFYDGCFVGRGSTRNSWIDLRVFETKTKKTIWEIIGNIYENKELLK